MKHQSQVSSKSQIRLEVTIMNIHKKHMKKSSILKFQGEDGLLVGHDECSQYLNKIVADLLLNPA